MFGSTIENRQGGFLGIEVKEMGLNRYLLCLFLIYCIAVLLVRLEGFGMNGCAEVFCFQGFLIPALNGHVPLLVQIWYG